MTIDEIREELAQKISMHPVWDEKTNETNPGNYGCEDVHVQLSGGDILVDLPESTFTFQNAIYSFTARIGESNEEDSQMVPFSTLAEGNGSFDKDKNNVEITAIEIFADLDIK